jgi:hypothetical protein
VAVVEAHATSEVRVLITTIFTLGTGCRLLLLAAVEVEATHMHVGEVTAETIVLGPEATAVAMPLSFLQARIKAV